MARGVPGWRFYFVLPDRWAREDQGLRRAFAVPNVTPVPLRFETANRTLNSLVLDAAGLRRFRQGAGDLEVDAVWCMCPEIIPELCIFHYGIRECTASALERMRAIASR